MRTLLSIFVLPLLSACAQAPQTEWQAGNRYGAIGFASGVEAAVLDGDLRQAELYTIRVAIMPSGTMPPHTHPDTRQMTVLEGEVWYGFGEAIDLETAPLYRAGDFFIVPGGQPHYARAGTEGVVYQESGMGPTATTPLE